MSTFDEQLAKIQNNSGFIAALDQSGGSTPKALMMYGIDDTNYNNEDEMFDRVHEMRTRIITNTKFTGERILGAILFEMTMNRKVKGQFTADYLWKVKNIVPFLKVDKGLSDEENNVQLMNPIPNLNELLPQAKTKNIFGTKMRSVIHEANEVGIENIVNQQFEIGKQIIKHELIPIIEPEVSINSKTKKEAEEILKNTLISALDKLDSSEKVMLKLTLPEEINLYEPCINHPNVLRVVALSGGYSRTEANSRLSKNNDMIASFSRALTEGLSAQQSDDEFTNVIGKSIEEIFEASKS